MDRPRRPTDGTRTSEASELGGDRGDEREPRAIAEREPAHRPRSILVVGGGRELASAVSGGLAHGYEVREAEGVEEALERTSGRKDLDALVTDLEGSEPSKAYALLELVRIRIPRCCRILLSSSPPQGDWFVRNGLAHRYVGKPCEPTALLRMLEELLG